jgi:hypothetical protein
MADEFGYRIYTAGGRCEATAKHAETAAAIVAVLGDDAYVTATLRGRGPLRGDWWRIWCEGPHNDGRAGESYDAAAELMHKRIALRREAAGLLAEALADRDPAQGAE